MATLTDDEEYTRLRQLPVIRELEQVYGPPAYKHLAGAPVSLAAFRVVRMPWVWFVDGRNFNLGIDHGMDGRWVIRAAGRAGQITFNVGAGERITHTMLRSVAVAAGLLS
jgi:hypothetical protein